MWRWRYGFSRGVSSERTSCWLSLVVLLGVGALLSRVPVSADVTGGALAAALVADWSWLKADLAWEAHDEARTRSWSAVAVRAAPAIDYFRINAARMRAFDFPAWREMREPSAPASVRVRWQSECAGEAIALLLDEPEPGAARLIEAGNIALHAQHDPIAAAQFYRCAAEMPGAPWHAGRIYAELLRRTGQDRAALNWLRTWLPRLPVDEPTAQRDLVVARIAELERVLAR